MQPLPPTSFPRRVKRFTSLSMTPFDCETDLNNDSQNLPSNSSNNYSSFGTNKTIGQYIDGLLANPVTNQFSFKNRKKLMDTGNFIFKNSLKAQLGSTNKQINLEQKNSNFFSDQKHKKMISSQIFGSSSINSKTYYSDQKASPNSSLIFRSGDRRRTQLNKMSNGFVQGYKKDREMHVPSFLLNKKRLARDSQISGCSQSIPRVMYESTPLNNIQPRNDEKRGSFRKQLLLSSLKSIQNQTQTTQEIFSPPRNEKFIYSKATSSTICTNLPRQESRRTFKDFEEMEELVEIQNSMEESDNQYGIRDQFENLFRKQERPNEDLQNEIAELFSDQDAESEEFDEDLKQELEDLF